MKKILYNTSPLIFLLIIFNLIFTRSFVGLEVLSFRLGEYIVLFGFIALIFLTFFYLRFKPSNEVRVITLIFIYFIFQLIFTRANIANTYTFKAASFIGMVSFFYLGREFYHEQLYVRKMRQFLPLLFPIIYLFGSSIYPNFLSTFFIRFSDKFEFIKASDILMAVIVIVFYFNVFESKKWNHFFIFIIIPAFLPILLYLSRGSFVALTVFFFMELFSIRKDLFSDIRKTFVYALIGFFIFIFSTLNIYGNLSFEKSNPLMNAELEKSQTEVLQENLQDLLERRNYVGVIFSLYIDNGTLKSTDGTLNWRLDIWQDLLADMSKNNKNIFGYGYNSILSVMTDPSEPGRMGSDGMNENIHNYFLNIFARGGFVLLFLFFYLHFIFVKKWNFIYKNYRLTNFIIPLLIASFFDVSMEGVQFPLSYYFFIGTFLKLKP
tara:strand:+ start:610 stop:1914 length:1305 start_codon:yes stop_codon:yes gene_type:complete